MEYLEKVKPAKDKSKDDGAKAPKSEEKRGGKVGLAEKLRRYSEQYGITLPKDEASVKYRVTASLPITEEIFGKISELNADVLVIQTRIKSSNSPKIFNIDDVVSISGGLGKDSSVIVKSSVVVSSVVGYRVSPKDALPNHIYIRTDDKVVVAFNRKSASIAIVGVKADVTR